MMRIAIPTNGIEGAGATVAEHFGRCETYTLFNEKGLFLKTIPNTSEHKGGVGLPPELLKKNEVSVLICGALGPQAIRLCETLGIDVYLASAQRAEEMVRLWLDGKARKAGSADGCASHKE